MQALRTIGWVVLTIVLVAFIAINWTPVSVNIWPTETGYLHLEWPVGFIVLVSYVLGLLPMWLLSKAGKWRMTRRINALENSVRATSTSTTTTTPPPPLATSTQLEANTPEEPSA